MKATEKQIVVEIPTELHTQVKLAATAEGVSIKKWAANAFELAVNFKAAAEEYCSDSGWTPPVSESEFIEVKGGEPQLLCGRGKGPPLL